MKYEISEKDNGDRWKGDMIDKSMSLCVIQCVCLLEALQTHCDPK